MTFSRRTGARMALILVMAISTGACTMSRTGKTALTGSAVGLGVGAGVAAVAGGPILLGAALGGAAGAASGTLYEKKKKR